MNNIIQQRKTEQRIYSLGADNHSFGKLFPLKRKANVKDKQRRVASFYIRIGFTKRKLRTNKDIFLWVSWVVEECEPHKVPVLYVSLTERTFELQMWL